MPRLVLLANHVLSSEPMAMQRMQPHCGKCIHLHLRDIPAPLSWLPSGVTVVVTAAGLLEWQPEASNGADLVATVDASSPARTITDVLAGRRPRVEVAGDAAFAADLSALLDHLRWDVQDDLARLVGDGPAVQLMRMGTALASGLRDAVRGLAQMAPDRWNAASAPSEPPPR